MWWPIGTSHPLHSTLVALASFLRTVGDPCTVREGEGVRVSRPQPRPEGPSIEQRCPLSPGEVCVCVCVCVCWAGGGRHLRVICGSDRLMKCCCHPAPLLDQFYM